MNFSNDKTMILNKKALFSELFWCKIGERNSTIFGKFTTDVSGATTIEKFILPIVKVETTEEVGGKIVASTFSVPQDSRVKFATISNGSVRSVTIDDGVLD